MTRFQFHANLIAGQICEEKSREEIRKGNDGTNDKGDRGRQKARRAETHHAEKVDEEGQDDR